MSKIISIHSFRGGTGKSNTAANLAVLFALRGKRVAVVDTDIQSPGVHILFGFDEKYMVRSLNDFLWGKCDIDQTAYDITANLKGSISGKVFLVPSSINPGEIARVLHDGYDVTQLHEGFETLIENLALDILLIDTHPGLNEETLLSISISDILIIILRPDYQDYQGTSVTLKIADKLDVPQMLLLINKVPSSFDFHELEDAVSKTYNCEVAGIVPHSDDMMILGSKGIFSLKYPEHPVSLVLGKIADRLI